MQLSHWCRPSLRRTSLNTCGRRRTWQTVQRPSRASATATPLRPWATRSKSVSASRDSFATTPPRAAVSLRAPARARALGVEHLLLARDLRLLGLQRRFGRLQLGGKRLRLLHVLEQLVFVRAHLVLGGGHLLLHRLVFLVGLDLHQLPLYLDSRPWTAASSFSISRRAAWPAAIRSLTASTAPVLFGDARFERLLRGGQFRDPPPGAVGRKIEFLKLDEMLEIRVHQ